jgi:predicted RNA-binding protein with TRAM domain
VMKPVGSPSGNHRRGVFVPGAAAPLGYRCSAARRNWRRLCSRVVICRDWAVTATDIGADGDGVKVVGSVGMNVAVSEWVPGVSVGVNTAAVPPNMTTTVRSHGA